MFEPSPEATIVENSASNEKLEQVGNDISSMPGRTEQIGIFDGGILFEDENGNILNVAGSPLPDDNQPDPPAPTVTYTDGIGLQNGICLCTGLMTPLDASAADLADIASQANQLLRIGQELGVAGPNNGQPLQESQEIHEGEISKLFGDPFEVEFRDVVPDAISNQSLRNDLRDEIEVGGDASVFTFKITTTSPGFLVVSFVYASDEEPFWTDDYNDIAAIIVEEDGQAPVNILTFRKRIDPQTLATRPLTLIDLADCPTLLRLNDVAPNPPILHGTLHATGNQEFFDHEFSIFTRVLTRITGDDPATELEIEREPLRPGTHRIKLVVHDVRDQLVDAALFVPEGGIRFMAVLPADFNLDGTVDAQDLNIYAEHEFGPGEFTDGDANFDGVVNTQDFNILCSHYLESGGFAMQSADFNYDGFVDGSDFNIWFLYKGSDDCISRSEGDTDDDGDVDTVDFNNWVLQAF